jgi:Lar family restriction alleviation protein
MKDAKPCPFCGSDNLYGFEYPFTRKPGIRGCFIRCNNCGAASGNHETIEDALKAWNERDERNE